MLRFEELILSLQIVDNDSCNITRNIIRKRPCENNPTHVEYVLEKSAEEDMARDLKI